MNEQNGHNGHNGSPAKSVARNAARFAHNIIELSELQVQLAKVEARQWSRAMLRAAVLIVAGGLLALGCIPVLVMSLAYVFVEFVGWTYSLSFLVGALVVMTVAGILLAVGISRMRNNSSALEQSRTEFQRNITWLKDVLRHEVTSNKAGV